MRYINDYSLKKELIAEGCNYIAFCITPWHLLGVRASLQYLLEHDITVKGYVCFIPHRDSGYILNDENIQHYEGVEFVKLQISPQSGITKAIGQILDYLSIRKIREKGLEKIYVVNPWRPNFEWCAFLSKNIKGKEIQAIVVDEGLAEYIDEKDKNVHAYSRISISATYNYLKDKYFKTKLESIMTERGLVNQFSLLMKNPCADISEVGEYSRNDFVIQYYKKCLLTDSIVEKQKLSIYENAVIINTQPFIEEGELLTNNDIKLLIEIVRILSKDGIRIILKPHPREANSGRYHILATEGNCVIDTDNKVSQESILSKLINKPKAIIGFTSTTLLTAKLFYDIETISVINCMDKNDFAEFQQPTIKNFVNSFKQIIHCISSVGEIQEIVK